MSEPDETPVSNPLRSELSRLLSQVQEARSQVPGMAGPLSAIGDGQAWQGPAARRFHNQHLSPTAQALYVPLDRLEDEVRVARDAQPAEVSPEQAELIRQQWGL
ncbi:hypothetical protein [Ornithinimicrobium pratense]|uniref:Uncharacterized protein n=1 Tax=Ornithinimicrobium pratense TaxID=2593973 RepID=A0A5J6V8K5_9MICO|nr:hypothetical protein [Ornithinimicrobium pratense]QFG69684.1 hypothetical protein FY030_14115 [Ornithinimicrobium pratense]